MMPHSTQYVKEYAGKNAHADLNQDFYALTILVDNLGIPLRRPKTQPRFEEDGKNIIAEGLVLLANEMPLAEVYLRGTKWGDQPEGQPVASLLLSIRHFKGLEARFPRFEELAKQYNLQSKGTHQSSSG